MDRRGRRNLLLLVGAALVLTGAGLGLLSLKGAAPGRTVSLYALNHSGRRLIARYPLGEASVGRVVRVKGPLGFTEVEVRGDRARVVSSPCRDKICVRFGWRSRDGEFAACLPNRLLLVVEERP